MFRNIAVILSANTGSFVTQMKVAGGALDDFARKGDVAAGRAEASASRTAKAWGAVGMAVATGLLAAGGAAGQFEQRMRNVSSISNFTEQGFRQAGQAVLDLSKTLPQSANQLAEGLYDIASSGFQGADGLKVLDASGKAASAGLSTTAEAAKAITASLNAYGLAADESANVSDTLFQTVNLGVINFSELTSVLGDTVGIAATAGITLDQVGAAIATMTLNGVSAAEAGTSLNRVIQSFINPSDAMKEAIKAAGYESGEMALRQDGLRVAMENVAKTTDGSLTSLQRLFDEQRALRGATGLLGGEMANYDRVLEGMSKRSEEGGATQKAFNEQMKSTTAQLKILRNEAMALVIEGMTPMLGVFVSGLKEGREFAGVVGEEIGEAVQKLRPFFSALADSGGDVMSMLDGVVDALGPLVGMLAALAGGAAIGALNALGMAVSGVTGFLADHQEIVVGLAALYGGRFLLGLAQSAAYFLIWEGHAIAATVAARGLSAAMAAMPHLAIALGIGALVVEMQRAKNAGKEMGDALREGLDLSSSEGLEQLRLRAQEAAKEVEKTKISFFGLGGAAEVLEDARIAKEMEAIGKAGEQASIGVLNLAVNVGRVAAISNQSHDAVVELAKKLGVDLTGAFNQSEPARNKLIEAFREMEGKAATAGISMVQAAAMGEEALEALAEATKKAGDAFSDHFDIISGLGQAQEDHAAALDAVTAASEAASDATDRVAQAQERAAEAAEGVGRAQERVGEAEERLAQMRTDFAEKNAEDAERYAERVADAQQAVLDAQEGVTDAQAEVGEAEARLAELRIEQAEKAAEAAERHAERVAEAQEKIIEAQEGVIEAQERVTEAEEHVAELRIEHAERAAEAQEEYAEKVEEANEDILRAEEDLAEKRISLARDVADAQRQLEEDRLEGQDRIRAAEQRVRDVQKRASDEARERSQREADRRRLDAAGTPEERRRIQSEIDARKAREDEAKGREKAARDLKDAQDDLAEARKKAAEDEKKNLEALKEAQENQAKGIQEAEERIVEARKKGLEVQKEGQKLAKQQAEDEKEIAKAIEAVGEAREGVVDAQEKVTEAQQNELDVQKEGQKLARQQLDDEKEIAEAVKSIADAREGVVDAQERLADALKDQLAAQKEGEKLARDRTDQERQLADAVKAVDDARRGVADAQRDAAKAAGEVGKAQADAADAYGKLADAQQKVKDTSPEGFFTRVVAEAKKFAEGIAAAAREGLDPRIIQRLLEEGPAKAMPFLEGILSGNVKRNVEMANEAQKTLNEMNQHVVTAMRITHLAVTSSNADMIRDYEKGMSILAETAKGGGKNTADAISKELGIGVEEVKRIARQYGIQLAEGINPLLEGLGKERISATGEVSIQGSGGRHMAAMGGVVPGVGDGDTVPAMLTPGEYVISKPAVQRIGVQNLEEMHQTARRGYAKGGFVYPEDVPLPPRETDLYGSMVGYAGSMVNKKAYDEVVAFVKAHPPAPSGGGYGYQALIDYLTRLGVEHEVTSTTRPGSITSSGNLSLHAVGLAADFVSSNMREIFDTFLKITPSLAELFWDPAGMSVKNGKRVDWIVGGHGGDNEHVHAATHAGPKDGPGVPGAPGASRTGGGDYGGEASSWINQALEITGKPKSWYQGLYDRMMQESGGRNVPQEIHDINTEKGTPAYGPMQVIRPTFEAYKQPGYDDWHNPVHSTAAAINYIAARYGSPYNLPKGGYAEGGLVEALKSLPAFHGGGVAPGRPGEEFLARLEGGEGILSTAAMARSQAAADLYRNLPAAQQMPDIASMVTRIVQDILRQVQINIPVEIDGREIARVASKGVKDTRAMRR